MNEQPIYTGNIGITHSSKTMTNKNHNKTQKTKKMINQDLAIKMGLSSGARDAIQSNLYKKGTQWNMKMCPSYTG